MSGTTDCVGFVEHHDNHDVFAMQLHGVKRWFVGPPIVGSPSHRYHYVDTHCTPQDELTMYETRAGDMLYIPLGWRHYALPGMSTSDDDVTGAGAGAGAGTGAGSEGNNSVHLTMGVQMPRWLDALESVPHMMGAWEAWLRDPLPATIVSRAGVGAGTTDTLQPITVAWDASKLATKLRELADCVEKSAAGKCVYIWCGLVFQHHLVVLTDV